MYQTRKRFLSVRLFLAVAFVPGIIAAPDTSVKAQNRERVGENVERIDSQPSVDRTLAPNGQGKSIVLTPSSPAVVSPAQAQSWSTATSDGSMDQASAAIAQLKSFSVTFQTGLTGTIHIKYNITATNGINAFCPATQSTIRVRYRNVDNSGVSSRVSFELRSSSLSAGGNNLLYTFSSDGVSNGSSFTTFSTTQPIDFDFTNNVYWIDATLFRSNSALFADLGTIQIWENSGTPCP
jgi:hypothetical protein